MKKLKNGLSIRGDSYYCPLAFQLDAYWNCEINCAHCFLRKMNRTWGDDLRPLDLELFFKKLHNGVINKDPKSPLSWALKNKKTIRFGNKTDPYQPAEKEHEISHHVLRYLIQADWSAVIQTKCTQLLYDRDIDLLITGNELFSVMPIISPGLEKDWEILEYKKTTHPLTRLYHCREFMKYNINVGVNGEPFIPGYHTLEDFKNTISELKIFGIKSYNTYHLHFNDVIAKNLHTLGIDIEKIYYMNQDREWKKILVKLIEIAEMNDIILGCPDFVNAGRYQEQSNTCCGLDVPNPCTYNMIYWKKLYMKGEKDPDVLRDRTWDGVGDRELGEKLLRGGDPDYYGLKDIKGI